MQLRSISSPFCTLHIVQVQGGNRTEIQARITTATSSETPNGTKGKNCTYKVIIVESLSLKESIQQRQPKYITLK